jgi:hypothetical protein
VIGGAIRTTAQRAVVAGAIFGAIIGGAAVAGGLGQAHADNPPCIDNPADQCAQKADQAATVPLPQRPFKLVCQPAGNFGAHCYRR